MMKIIKMLFHRKEYRKIILSMSFGILKLSSVFLVGQNISIMNKVSGNRYLLEGTMKLFSNQFTINFILEDKCVKQCFQRDIGSHFIKHILKAS